MKCKYNMTEMQATLMAFNQMDDVFSAPDLCKLARKFRGSPVMDGTTLRRLRDLRADRVINYDPIDRNKSIYKKLEVKSKNIEKCFLRENQQMAQTHI